MHYMSIAVYAKYSLFFKKYDLTKAYILGLRHNKDSIIIIKYD